MARTYGFEPDLFQHALENKNYRTVIHTSKLQQTVLMHLQPGQKIDMEVHPHTHQTLIVIEGRGVGIVAGNRHELTPGAALEIDPNNPHEIIAHPDSSLRLISIYSPPEHPPGLVQQTKPK